MDDSEIEARFGAMRTAFALAISIGRSPSDLQHLRAALRDIIAFVPDGAHPALRDELERVLSTFVRLPTQHAASEQSHAPAPNKSAVAPGRETPARFGDEATISELL